MRITLSPDLFAQISANTLLGNDFGMSGNTSIINPSSGGWWKNFFTQNLTFNSFIVPDEFQSNSVANGNITTTASNISMELSVSGNYGSWWRKIGSSDDFEGTLSTSTASINAILNPTIIDGIPGFEISEASLELGKLSSTGPNRNWSAFLLRYPNYQTQLASAVNNQFVNFSTQVAINDIDLPELLVSISSNVESSAITNDYVSFTGNGTAYLTDQGYADQGIENNINLPVHDYEENFQIYLSQYTAQTALSALYANGNVSLTLLPEDIPDISPFTGNTLSLGLLIPQMSATYPSGNIVRMSFVADPDNAPTVSFNENLAFAYYYTCSMDVLVDTDTYENACVLSGLLNFVGSVNVNDNRFGYTVSSVSFSNSTVESSNIGVINTSLFQFKVNLAGIGLVNAINTGTADCTMPIPDVFFGQSLILNDSDFTLENGYLSFVANATANISQ